MIPLVVVAVAVAVTVVLVLAELVLGRRRPLDTELPERWLVRHAPKRVRPIFRRVDRRIVGGVAIAISLVVVAVGGTVVGTILDSVDEDRGIARWDESAAEWGARNATDASTFVLRAITQLGGTGGLLVIMLGLGVWEFRRSRTWGPLAYLGAVGLGVVVLNNTLKIIVDRERPMFAQLTGAAGTSFPSGHSAAAAACWAAIALVLFRRGSKAGRAAGAIAAVLVAVAVATTRVLLGVHWISDVVAGVVVGWVWFGVVTLIFGGRLLRLGEPSERIAQGRAEAPVGANVCAQGASKRLRSGR